MLRLGSSIEQLLRIREEMGWLYGSEDLCVLLYSLVKREKPAMVVELGTGLGVSTAWIAAAMKEAGRGVLHTYDNGSHYISEPSKKFLSGLSEPLNSFANLRDGLDGFNAFIGSLLSWVGAEEHVVVHLGDIAMGEVASDDAFQSGVDMVFSDFNHSPESIQALLGAFLPVMRETSSIFIDSASTHRLSYLALEKIVEHLNQGRLPAGLTKGLDELGVQHLETRVRRSSFRLMHLTETSDRAQNSTAWVRIEPIDIQAAGVKFFH
ncbi:class I SAM-dependent methyltransferase [Xanthomonas albilineans]|uniref:class I SAM-dependent methyltransferase n=1 Tax=Xanthomonas albilineans TaxID=29447 RepID=UPI0005F31DF5|nr:class I SAM-dependent methyltransferase [Xanthomonas albilineans]PPU94881.1 class I SAM-dependent methyltransferase [Xanthomonas albilineans]